MRAGCSTNNVSTSTRFCNRVDSMIAKIDQNFNANNLLTGRYYFGDSSKASHSPNWRVDFFPATTRKLRLGCSWFRFPRSRS